MDLALAFGKQTTVWRQCIVLHTLEISASGASGASGASRPAKKRPAKMRAVFFEKSKGSVVLCPLFLLSLYTEMVAKVFCYGKILQPSHSIPYTPSPNTSSTDVVLSLGELFCSGTDTPSCTTPRMRSLRCNRFSSMCSSWLRFFSLLIACE